MADSAAAAAAVATASQSINRPPRSRRRGGNNRPTNQPDIHHDGQPHQPTVQTASIPTRQFGGHLSQPARLQAEAPPFVPASVLPIRPQARVQPQTQLQEQTVAPNQTQSTSKRKGRQRGPKDTPIPQQPPALSHVPGSRRFSRSNAPDLATRIHEDIAHNLYECAICSNEVGRNSKVWSCGTCWTVFHIGCIKKWSKNEGSAVQRSSQEDPGYSGKQWRCPGCNLPQTELPAHYACWCEKEMDPKVITGLPPHSCGQTCGRERKFPKACPHPCDQLCHAGPCPPCTSMGPVQSCFCGKKTSNRRCAETDYEAGWSCGEVCGDMMPCGEHFCQQACHEGLCGGCTTEVEARCYCGKSEKTIPCSERDVELESYGWKGRFDCRQPCDRAMDCGVHRCEKECHPQDTQAPHCPKSPDVVTHCPCGKTSLLDLNSEARTACTDPIPNCDETCNKLLPCGHQCSQNCHTGDCPSCFLNVPITCRCGRCPFEVPCYGGRTEQPWCRRTCRATLNCGRHECGEHCCPGEKRAVERQAMKRKLKPLAARVFDNEIEAEHICTRVCGRMLKCGNHTCPDLCHKGPCNSCKEAIFEDISCNCGRTVLQAPLPCGTRAPPCTFPCQRTKSCRHPQTAHNCHTDEEECPKCPFLTEKQCLCGKKSLKNQPCWRSDVLCGLICGKLLKCGSHTCTKTCHRAGECEDAQTHCQQECGKSKKTCGHPCERPCHAPSACKEDVPCPFKIMITCDCQRKKEEVKCNARAGVLIPPGRQNSLKCDDECARLERNRKLASALQISDDHMDDHIPYSTTTLNLYLADIAWAHKQEEIMRMFAADENERRYRFGPMKARQRSFIHSLADDFGFDGESLDPEPHRHVLLFKTPKFVAAPMKTLAQAARVKRAQLSLPVAVDASAAPRRADEVVKPVFNGFLLQTPRFALTEGEVKATVGAAVPTTDFATHFLTSTDAIALLPLNQWDGPEHVATLLETLLPSLWSAITTRDIAASVVLCEFDSTTEGQEPRIVNSGGSKVPGAGSLAGGWSQVAAKRAGPMAPLTVKPVGQQSTFTVLGSRLAEAKMRKKEEEEMKRRNKVLQSEPVVDDWSQEVVDE